MAEGIRVTIIRTDCAAQTDQPEISRKTNSENRTEILTLHGAQDIKQAALQAEGEYLCFSDSAVFYPEDYMKEMYRMAASMNADVIVSRYRTVDFKGHDKYYPALRVPMEKNVLNYRDCPKQILDLSEPVLFNRLIRKDLLLKSGLLDEIEKESAETAILAGTMLQAEKIVFVDDPFCTDEGYQRRSDPADVLGAVKNTLNYSEGISVSAERFAAQQLAEVFVSECRDFEDEHTADFYRSLHEFVQNEAFDRVQKESSEDRTYRWLQVFRKYSCEDLCRLVKGRKLIVSLTTYPARINLIHKVLQTIYRQTRTPDEVILWLADSQFPGLEKDLPADLLKLITDGRLTVKWCRDIRPHKKYLFAMKEYPEDLIVTIDDDLYYDPYMVEYLYLSYLEYPEYVSACRTHLIAMDKDHNLQPYNDWIRETNLVISEPCMELFATGGAGTLYPPHLFDETLLDPDLVQKLCPIADDLWLKTMEILKDIPVVQAYPFDNLWYIENSQTEGLVHDNVDRNMNDVQLEKIREWADGKYGEKCLENGIVNSVSSQVPYGLYQTSLRFRPLMEENERLKSEYNKLRNDFDNVVNSVSFKTGRTITSLLRNIRDLFRRK